MNATAVEPNFSPNLSPGNLLDGKPDSYACTSREVDDLGSPDYFEVRHNNGSFGFTRALVHITALHTLHPQEYFLPARVFVGPPGSAHGEECGRLPGHEPNNEEGGRSNANQSFVVRCTLTSNNSAIKIGTDRSRLESYPVSGDTMYNKSICIGDVRICEDTDEPPRPPPSPPRIPPAPPLATGSSQCIPAVDDRASYTLTSVNDSNTDTDWIGEGVHLYHSPPRDDHGRTMRPPKLFDGDDTTFSCTKRDTPNVQHRYSINVSTVGRKSVYVGELVLDEHSDYLTPFRVGVAASKDSNITTLCRGGEYVKSEDAKLSTNYVSFCQTSEALPWIVIEDANFGEPICISELCAPNSNRRQHVYRSPLGHPLHPFHSPLGVPRYICDAVDDLPMPPSTPPQ